MNEKTHVHETMVRYYEALLRIGALDSPVGRQSALARALNTSPQRIKNWESRGVSREGQLEAQSKFGINATWLATGDGDMLTDARDQDRAAPSSLSPSSNSQDAFLSAESNAHPGPKIGPITRIPVVGHAQLGDNGYWSELQYPVGHGDGYVMFATTDHKAYALRCEGDSMQPRIKNGEFVVVYPSSEAIPGDEVLVRTTDGRVMVKELLYVRDGAIHLASVNESHGRITISQTEVDKLHPIAGIVKRLAWVPE